MDKFFSANVNTLTTKYPVQAAEDKETMIKNQDYIYATVLFRLATDITLMFVRPANNIAKQQETTKRFEEQYEFTIPSFDLDSIRLPVLSLHADLEEAELEKYSRVNILLKLLQTYMALSKKKHARTEIFES